METRWCSIFLVAVGPRKIFIFSAGKQHFVRSKLCLVLVHYTFGISIASLLVTDRGFSFSNCRYCVGLRPESGWISFWFGMERLSDHGPHLL
jgi:hypothetical protein